MYTQCPKCETVFKLSAETLRTAGGQVRCGKCGEVFNALARLAEDATAFAAGESPLDLEARADSILESVVPAREPEPLAKDSDEFAPPGVEIARLEILDWPEEDQTPADDRSLEFTLPPGELDRIFVESKKQLRQILPRAPQQPQPATQPDAAQPQPAEPPQSADQPQLAAQPQAAEQPHPEAQPVAELQPAPPEEPPPHPESMVAADPPARMRVSGFEVPEDVRREMLAGFEQFVNPGGRPQISPRRAPDRRWYIAWLSAAVAAALLLMVQIVHRHREWLGVLHALGAPSSAPANLSAYQLRQWGVTGDPAANGTLRLRASILNTAAQLQPYPLLRVTLADRFGKGIGSRDFEAGEYLGKPTARLLAPGERVDATLDILDPGRNAEGFEVDVCLRGVDQRVACAADVAAQTKR